MFPSLARIHKTAISVDADRSCFHALANQIFNDPDLDKELRQTVVKYLDVNRNVFKGLTRFATLIVGIYGTNLASSTGNR